MRFISKFYFILVVAYIIIYKIFYLSFNDIMNYIINPLIWILLCFLGFILLYQKNKRYYQYKLEIIDITIISSLMYILLFYSLGFFIGFSNNPYSKDISGIIINLFSIIMVIGLKQGIRGILINEVMDKSLIYVVIITLIFIIDDLNLAMVINNLNTFNLFFHTLVEIIVPTISVNIFLTFLCYKGGLIPVIIYKIITTLPSILIPVVPRYDIIVPMLFDVLFPLFTYLIIMYQINRKDEYNKRFAVKPGKWILTFLITIFLLMFSLGIFKLKPVVILSGSMRPKINEGDLLIIEKCSINSVKEGDIIEFRLDNYSVVHRVVRKVKNGEGITFITKGDNNIKEDQLPVAKENFRGCLKYRIPYLGYPAYLIRKFLT